MNNSKLKQPPECERIAKKLSRAGVCSRRQAEKFIFEGRIKVNGLTITTPATKVSIDEGRTTIFDILPRSLPRVMSVGRLDYDSEGLILLTNNGETSRKLELPSTGWLRKYKVRVHGFVDNKKLDKLKNGIKLDSFRTGPIDANLEIQKGTNAWVSIGLREGKNREVRRIMDYLGYPVNRLIRISYGPFQLGNLQKGETAEINKDVVSNQLGLMNKLK